MKNWTDSWRQLICHRFHAESLGRNWWKTVIYMWISVKPAPKVEEYLCQESLPYFMILSLYTWKYYLFLSFVPCAYFEPHFVCLWAEFFTCSMISFCIFACHKWSLYLSPVLLLASIVIFWLIFKDSFFCSIYNSLYNCRTNDHPKILKLIK